MIVISCNDIIQSTLQYNPAFNVKTTAAQKLSNKPANRQTDIWHNDKNITSYTSLAKAINRNKRYLSAYVFSPLAVLAVGIKCGPWSAFLVRILYLYRSASPQVRSPHFIPRQGIAKLYYCYSLYSIVGRPNSTERPEFRESNNGVIVFCNLFP